MIELLLTALLVVVAFIGGYLVGKKKESPYVYYATNAKVGRIDGPPEEVTYMDKAKEIVRELVDHPSFDEPSGAVYRPSPQELAKMNEDEATKQAKAAMAETFKNAPPAPEGNI